MKLTDKCKIDFEKWLYNLKYSEPAKFNNYYNNFKDTPESMQYGVYVDFFDSVGIILDVQPVLNYNHDNYTDVNYWISSVFQLNVSDEDYNNGQFETRQKGRELTITEANKIYNEK